MKSNTEIFSVRQGDVLIVDANYLGDRSPDGKVVNPDGRHVLAHGEVTGHAHAISDVTKVRLLDVNAERYLQVLQQATLSHEEHRPIVLMEGRYQQAFQVEEQGEEVRRVED